MGYRWNDFVSNQRLLHETGLRSVTSRVCERQLQLYGHVACLPNDPAHRVLSVRDNLSGGDQGDSQATHGWGKSIRHAGTGFSFFFFIPSKYLFFFFLIDKKKNTIKIFFYRLL